MIPPHVHRLQPDTDAAFLAAGWADPFTRVPFRAGSPVVVCAVCGTPFLRASWEAIRGTHCGQTASRPSLPPGAPNGAYVPTYGWAPVAVPPVAPSVAPVAPVAASVATAPVVPPLRPTRPERPAAPPPEPERRRMGPLAWTLVAAGVIALLVVSVALWRASRDEPPALVEVPPPPPPPDTVAVFVPDTLWSVQTPDRRLKAVVLEGVPDDAPEWRLVIKERGREVDAYRFGRVFGPEAQFSGQGFMAVDGADGLRFTSRDNEGTTDYIWLYTRNEVYYKRVQGRRGPTFSTNLRPGTPIATLLGMPAPPPPVARDTTRTPADDPARVNRGDVPQAPPTPPELIGGLATLERSIKYPAAARSAGVQGRVVVQFTVDETGSASEVVVVRGLGYGLDEAALDAVRRARFAPGTQNGQPVRTQFTLPITFRLGE